MREAKLEKAVDFTSYSGRRALGDHLTYGHFNIGDGVSTVCGVLHDDKLYYAVSFCSPKDNFSRRRGRHIAFDHLVWGQYSSKRGVLIVEGDSGKVPPAILLKQAVERHLEKMTPQWAKGHRVEFRSKPKNKR